MSVSRLSEDLLRECARELGVRFNDAALLRRALLHGSAAADVGAENNERLEFLGDAVLDLVASEWLFKERRDDAEGLLTQRRSRLVSGKALAKIAVQAGLERWIILSTGEERSGGRAKRSVLANAVEALLGALYLDGGLAAAREWVLPHLRWLDSTLDESVISDAKNRLQEQLQAQGLGLPEYRTVDASGPAHARTFVVECWIAGTLSGSGTGSSKRRAERRAAQQALLASEAPATRPND